MDRNNLYLKLNATAISKADWNSKNPTSIRPNKSCKPPPKCCCNQGVLCQIEWPGLPFFCFLKCIKTNKWSGHILFLQRLCGEAGNMKHIHINNLRRQYTVSYTWIGESFHHWVWMIFVNMFDKMFHNRRVNQINQSWAKMGDYFAFVFLSLWWHCDKSTRQSACQHIRK